MTDINDLKVELVEVQRELDVVELLSVNDLKQDSDIDKLQITLGSLSNTVELLKALTEQVLELQSTVDSLSSDVGGLSIDVSEATATSEASVTQVSEVIALENYAHASLITSLNAELTNLETEITGTASIVQELSVTVSQDITGDITANALSVEALNARVGDTEASIITEKNVTANLSYSLASLDTELNSQVDSLTSNVSGQSTITTSLQTSVSTINGELVSQASDITNLYVRTGANTSAYDTEVIVRAGETFALGQRIDRLSVEVGENDANITRESFTRADEVSALASTIDTVTTTVGDNTASIVTQANSIDGIAANYSVKLNVNGHIAGIGLTSTEKDDVVGGNYSEFIVAADKFIIAGDYIENGGVFTALTSPFYVDAATGDTYINSAIIEDATITGAKIVDGEITNAKIGNTIQSIDYTYVPEERASGWLLDKENAGIRVHNLQVVDAEGQTVMSSGGNFNWGYVTGEDIPEANATIGADSSNLIAGVGKNLIYNAGLQSNTVGWEGINIGIHPNLALGGPAATLGTAYAGSALIDETGHPIDALTGELTGEHPDDDVRGNTIYGYDAAVSPGDRIEAFVYTGALRCDVSVWIEWIDVNGSIISSTEDVAELNTPSLGRRGGQHLSGYLKHSIFATAPGSTVAARLVIHKSDTIAMLGFDSYMTFVKPFIGIAGPAQTEHSPWSDGTNGLNGKITPENVTTYIAEATIDTLQVVDLSIETLKIKDNAVTVPEMCFSADQIPVTQGNVVEQVISLTIGKQDVDYTGIINFGMSCVLNQVPNDFARLDAALLVNGIEKYRSIFVRAYGDTGGSGSGSYHVTIPKNTVVRLTLWRGLYGVFVDDTFTYNHYISFIGAKK